jgi:hypothetical protein
VCIKFGIESAPSLITLTEGQVLRGMAALAETIEKLEAKDKAIVD